MAAIQRYTTFLGKSIGDTQNLFYGGYTDDMGNTISDVNWAQFGFITDMYGYTFILAENIPCEEVYIRKKYTDGQISKKEQIFSWQKLALTADVEVIYIMFYKLSPTFVGSLVFQARPALPYYKDCQITYKKESDHIFLRKGLSAQFSLHGEDFDFIAGANIDREFRLIFYSAAKRSPYLDLYFYKTDCSFDYTKKKCSLSDLRVVDQYSNVLNNYSKEYDLLQLKTPPATTSINTKVRGIQQIYISGASQVTNFMNGVYWEEPVNTIQDSYQELVHTYHFGLAKVFMEITFENSPLSDVNGVYTGEFSYDLDNLEEGLEYEDSYILKDYKFTNQKGYYIELDYAEMGNYPIYLKNPQGEVLYTAPYMGQGSNIKPDFFLNTSFAPDPDREGLSPLKATSAFRYHLYKRLLCAVDSIGEMPLYDLPVDDFATTRRNLKKCIGSQLDMGLIIFISNSLVSTPTRYGKAELGLYYTPNVSSTSGIADKVCPIARSSWANASLWFASNYSSPSAISFDNAAMQTYTVKDTWRIDSVIRAMLTSIAPEIKHEASAEYSQFLYARQELGLFPELASFEVFIAPKSNITHLNYDQPAQTAKLSFESLMTMLKDCFQCYWFVDNKNRLRIEHISYFKNGYTYDTSIDKAASAIDIRKKIDSINKKAALYAQNIIKFEKEELPSRYEFTGWMDKSSFAFEGLAIDIKAGYVNKEAVCSIGSSNFSSDIDLMYAGASSFSDEGFALLCAQKNENNEYYLPFVLTQIKDEGYTPTIYAQNWYASWLYLARLYMYDMPSENIETNKIGGLVVRDLKDFAVSSISIRAQNVEEIVSGGLLTNFGLGRVRSISENIHTGFCDVELLHRLK